MKIVTQSKICDDTGTSVVVWHVDACAPPARPPITTLVKCAKQIHSMRSLRTIRISKPAYFRDYGEGLVRDSGEGQASTTVITAQRIDDPEELREQQEFYDEVGRCAHSVGQELRMTAEGTKTTTSHTSRVTFAKNCWIYSTAIEPENDVQWQRLAASMEPEYNHVDYIRRPSQFAWSLGLMVIDHLGPQGADQLHTDTYDDEVIKTLTKGQLIVHGPVVYVPDPFRAIHSAQTDVERFLLPVFVKNRRFAAQREYRFIIWAEDDPVEDVVDLDISCAMFGATEEPPLQHPAWLEVPQTADSTPEPVELHDGGEKSEDCSESQVPLDSTADWFWPGLLGNDYNPATPLSRTIDPADFADNPRAATTAAALSALRFKVTEVQGERRSKVASAAWHAEPWICHLCIRFMDPIRSVLITDDNILVVSLKFPEGIDAEVKLSFGPTGAYVHAVRGTREQLILHSSNPDTRILPPSLSQTLSRLGLKPWPQPDTSSTEVPS